MYFNSVSLLEPIPAIPCEHEHQLHLLQEREAILLKVADVLEEREEEIMQENNADVDAAEGKIDDQLMNRLRLKPGKIQQLADGIRSIAAQDEPLRKVRPASHPLWRRAGCSDLGLSLGPPAFHCGMVCIWHRYWPA